MLRSWSGRAPSRHEVRLDHVIPIWRQALWFTRLTFALPRLAPFGAARHTDIVYTRSRVSIGFGYGTCGKS